MYPTCNRTIRVGTANIKRNEQLMKNRMMSKNQKYENKGN